MVEKLTPNQVAVMKYFAEASPGKGRVIPKNYKRIFSGLISKGWAWSLGFGGNASMVGLLTIEGREVLEDYLGVKAGS